MKRFAASILFLCCSAASTACGYYPYGENLRFRLFDPGAFGFKDYSSFYYTAYSFYPGPWGYAAGDTIYRDNDPGKRMNIALWRKRCNDVPPDSAVREAVYADKISADNAFVLYLYKHRDTAAIGYLNFARACTDLSDLLADPWERNRQAYSALRDESIRSAIARAGASADDDIRLRYAFQAIRMAYYNHDPAQVKAVYATFFSARKEKTIIDYWGLHFRTLVEPKGPAQNYYAAQVFANAPDKRFAVYGCYDKTIPVREALAFAKTNEEKAAVWLLEGVRRHGRALECMQRMNELSPDHEGLDFLLAREISKLEDWIFTPRYANFEPVLVPYTSKAYNSDARMQQKINADRAYAKQVLDFAAQKKAAPAHRATWEACGAYLQFMSGEQRAALAGLSGFKYANPAITEQVSMIRSLCLVAVQDSGTAVIPEEVKPVLLRQHRLRNQRFLFAVAKELEFLGNTTDAALLMMKINPEQTDWHEEVFWRTRKKATTNYWIFQDDYFNYINIEYTTGQLKALVADIEAGHRTDTFTTWKYATALREVPRLYDLIGTKYMRLSQYGKALEAFTKVNDTLWTSANMPFHEYLNANPFYADMYSGHSKRPADSVRYDKESITRTLMDYLGKAEDTLNPHRDYYYFLVANCYFNMTQYGNSWMMKRYYWGVSCYDPGLPDADDYFGCRLARAAYLKAKTVTRSKKFAALCLRMAARCEGLRLDYEREKEQLLQYEAGNYNYTAPKAKKKNTYYRQLKREFPDDYDELTSNCYSFEEYFKTWK